VKKVLYLSYDGMTDPLGQSQVLPYLSALSSQGYRFSIISFEKKNRLAQEREIIEKITNSSAICWHPLQFTRRPPVLSKIYDRWKLKRKVASLYRQQPFDMIHCRSYVSAEVGLWMKEKFGVKFLFDMRGFWADEKVDNGQWNLKNPLFRLIYKHYKKKERSFLEKADGIVSLTLAAKNNLLEQEIYKNLDIDVIPCCADLDHFDYSHSQNGLASGLREQAMISQGQKVITYLGSVGGWYMINEMFSFFRRLVQRYPDFVLLVLTKDDPIRIKKMATDAGIAPDKIRVTYAGRNELPEYISLSDCSIFFIRPSFSKIASSPTKHAELMGMGVPVICNDIGDTGRIIRESGTGVLVNEFTETEYDRVIGEMDRLIQIPKEKIREAAIKYFDLETGAAQYLEVYDRILGRK
jgi:glycosyltransferase involved in cell wall biosynthesis